MADGNRAWARYIEHIASADEHLEGRRLAGPQQGFGQMWQKTYRIGIPDHEPGEVITVWKQNYGSFWPKLNRFNAPLAGIQPGEVASISSMQILSTGVVVIYCDESSFSFMTPEGHPFAGWITFSVSPATGGSVAQVQLLIRASDPIWEFCIAFGMGKGENWMWRATLKALAKHLDSTAEPRQQIDLVDHKRIWANAGNWRRNALLSQRLRRRPQHLS